MQKLSKRLQAVADFVTPGNRAADIGTDHGFLPIYLVQSGRCPHVIAMDLREGPLERAGEHIAAVHLENCIQVRMSDGMNGLSEGEADSAVIAGMGGLTVIQILEAGQKLLPGLKELILGPQSDIAKVRKWLREHRMYIDKEELVFESGKFYPVLHVIMEYPEMGEAWLQNRENVKQVLRNKLSDDERVRRIFDQYGEYLVCGRHPVLSMMLERDMQRENVILCGLRGSIDTETGCRENRNAQRIQEAEKRAEEIRGVMEIIAKSNEKEKSEIEMFRLNTGVKPSGC